MSLGAGAFHVANGTTVQVEGAVDWQLLPGAAVVNDGVIDLGTQATLQEQTGEPITGGGTEVSTWPNAAPLAGVDPGTLGLSVTTNYADGGLVVRRGHTQSEVLNGTLSIARWYGIRTPTPTSESMTLGLHYDATELLGIVPENLSVFSAATLTSTWVPLAGTNDVPTHTLTAFAGAPEIFVTAYDLLLALSVEGPSDEEARVWPTIIDGPINIALPQNELLQAVELFDARGRSLWRTTAAGTLGNKVELPSLASGAYVMRINNGRWNRTLIQP